MTDDSADRRWIRWLDEETPAGPSTVGTKGATIARLRAAGLPVVEGFGLTVHAWRHFLAASGIANDLTVLLRDVDLSGFELVRISRALRTVIEDAPVPADLAGALRTAGRRAAGTQKSLIVRSSATVEDLPGVSAAGLHSSRADVELDRLPHAVREVWASLHSLPALYYRLRRGLLSTGVEMGVLIQRQLHPRELGVLFTADPVRRGGYLVEWRSSEQDSEAVTDGAPPRRRVHGGAGAGAAQPPWLPELVGLGERVVDVLGRPADVEWARAGGELVVLQARPSDGTRQPSPTGFTVVSADDEPGCRRIDLAECADLHARWSAKHRRARREATAADIDTVRSWYAEFGAAGVAPAAAELLSQLRTPYLFLDVTEKLRSIVVPRDALSRHLSLLLGEQRTATVRVRECFTDHSSLLSGVLADDVVLVEHTPGGIKGLIRGLSSADAYEVTPEGDVRLVRRARGGDEYVFDRDDLAFRRAGGAGGPDRGDSDGVDAAILRTVSDFTRRISRGAPAALLEWSVSDGTPHLLDHSLERSAGSTGVAVGTEVLSFGSASGRAFVLDDASALEYISDGNLVSVGAVDGRVREDDAVRELLRAVRERATDDPVILVTPRPVTALSLLVEEVDGFVFDDGALLSHLAILIREAGRPAVLLRDATRTIADGQWVTITADGTVEGLPTGGTADADA